MATVDAIRQQQEVDDAQRRAGKLHGSTPWQDDVRTLLAKLDEAQQALTKAASTKLVEDEWVESLKRNFATERAARGTAEDENLRLLKLASDKSDELRTLRASLDAAVAELAKVRADMLRERLRVCNRGDYCQTPSPGFEEMHGDGCPARRWTGIGRSPASPPPATEGRPATDEQDGDAREAVLLAALKNQRHSLEGDDVPVCNTCGSDATDGCKNLDCEVGRALTSAPGCRKAAKQLFEEVEALRGLEKAIREREYGILPMKIHRALAAVDRARGGR